MVKVLGSRLYIYSQREDWQRDTNCREKLVPPTLSPTNSDIHRWAGLCKGIV